MAFHPSPGKGGTSTSPTPNRSRHSLCTAITLSVIAATVVAVMIVTTASMGHMRLDDSAVGPRVPPLNARRGGEAIDSHVPPNRVWKNVSTVVGGGKSSTLPRSGSPSGIPSQEKNFGSSSSSPPAPFGVDGLPPFPPLPTGGGHREEETLKKAAEAAYRRVPPRPWRERDLPRDHRGQSPPAAHKDDLSMELPNKHHLYKSYRDVFASDVVEPYEWDDGQMLAEEEQREGGGKIRLSPVDETAEKALAERRSNYDSRAWYRSADERDFRKDIRMHFGVLTIARFVNTRLLPMLNTSLLHATSVDVFIRKTNVSYAVADYIRASVRQFHPHWRGIRVVELYGPDPNNKEFYKSDAMAKNSWQNLEILRLWNSEAAALEVGTINNNKDSNNNDTEAPNWYCVVDDDGYVLIDNAKAMLWDLEQDRTLKRDLALSISNANTTQSIDRDAIARRARYSSPPPPLLTGVVFGTPFTLFANGGPGFYFNREALLLINKERYNYCLGKFVWGAGDAIASACFMGAGVELRKSPHVCNGGMDRSLYENMRAYEDIPFPASFHYIYGGMRALHILRTLEAWRRERGELVHWYDIALNFGRGKPHLHREEFYTTTATTTTLPAVTTGSPATVTATTAPSTNMTKPNIPF